MRQVLATILPAVLLAAAVPAHAASPRLTDVQGHWASQQVEQGVADGYIAGYPDGRFLPDQPITRAEFFKLLGAALRLQPSQRNVDFQEVQHWAFVQGHIPAAVEAGLINPTDYGPAFGPDSLIKRREIVLAAVRSLGKQASVDEQNAVLNSPDAGEYLPWLRGWATVAMADGIITGYEDRTLGLERNATRAEALVMVQRILAKVTLSLADPGALKVANTARHPGEGEPAWSWTEAGPGGHPEVTDGTDTLALTADAWGLRVLPAPGGAAWISYSARGEGTASYGVVGRVFKGQLTDVGRFPDHTPDLLAVGDNGQLWFSDGNAQLMVAAPDGTTRTIEGISQRLFRGAVDWNGALWATDGQRLFKVDAAGTATPIAVAVPVGDEIVQIAATGGDSVWLLVRSNAWEHRAQAVQLVGGRESRRINLLGHYSTSEQVSAAGQAGPFLWMVSQHQAGIDLAQDGIFKLDMTTAAFSRLVLPRSLAGGELVKAPEGGALLRDTAGKFWRVMP